MANPPIEGSEDKYKKGTEEYDAFLEGREAMMEGLGIVLGGKNDPEEACPYSAEQPHLSKKRKAWLDGWYDEEIWAQDSTGR